MTDGVPDMPQHVLETIQAITLLHAEHNKTSTFAERIADKSTAFVGRPRFLLGLLTGAALWIAFNLALKMAGYAALDPAPFPWLELAISAASFFVAILILTSQRRADKFANLREQMTLEATLLTEQKTRKIIELLEELRRDSPQIKDRDDPEASEMAKKADPHTVLGVIEEHTAAAIKSADDGTAPESADPSSPEK